MHVQFHFYYFILLALGVAALFWMAKTFSRNKNKKSGGSNSTSASAVKGNIEIQGFAWNKLDPVSLPSGYDGVYYQFYLQELIVRRDGAKQQQEWKTVFSKNIGDEFYLVDDKGVVTVSCNRAEFNFDHATPLNWKNLSSEKQKYLTDRIIDVTIPNFPPENGLRGLTGSPFRIVEHEVQVGTPLKIKGYFSKIDDRDTTQIEDFKGDSENLDSTQVIGRYNPHKNEHPEPVAEEAKAVQLSGLDRFINIVYKKNSDEIKSLLRHLKKEQANGKNGAASVNPYSLVAHEVRETASNYKNNTEKDFTVYGKINASPEHGLTIYNNYETAAAGSSSGPAILRWAAVVACVAIGAALKLTKHPEVLDLASLAGKSESTVKIELNVAQLQKGCAGGNLHSCEYLILHAKELNLTEAKYYNYYLKKACDLNSTELKCK